MAVARQVKWHLSREDADVLQDFVAIGRDPGPLAHIHALQSSENELLFANHLALYLLYWYKKCFLYWYKSTWL